MLCGRAAWCTNFDGIAGLSDGGSPKTHPCLQAPGKVLTLLQLDSALDPRTASVEDRTHDGSITHSTRSPQLFGLFSSGRTLEATPTTSARGAVSGGRVDATDRNVCCPSPASSPRRSMSVERHRHASNLLWNWRTKMEHGPSVVLGGYVTRATARRVKMATITQPQTKDASEAHSAYRHVLVPLDGDPLFERVLPYVERITGCARANVTLLRATNPRSDTGSFPGLGYNPLALPRAADLEAANAVAYLERIAARLRASGVETERAPLLDEPRTYPGSRSRRY